MTRILLLFLLAATLPAQAALVTDDGWSAGPARGTLGVTDEVLGLVDDEYWVVQPRGSVAQCVSAGAPAFGLVAGSGSSFVAFRRGVDDGVYSVEWGQQPQGQTSLQPALTVVRARCEAQVLESVLELPPGSVGIPPPFDGGWRGPLPTRDDGTTYLPTTEGLYTLNLDAPEAPTPFVSLEALRGSLQTALPDPYPWTSSAPSDELRLVSGTVTPQDALWLLVEQQVDGAPAFWIVELGRDGAVSIVASPSLLRGKGLAPQRLVYASDLNAALLLGGYRWWLVPLEGTQREGIERLPWLSVSDDGQAPPLAQGPDGRVSLGLQPVTFDPSALDPDRDLLTSAVEASLGLSPYDDDTDDDGVSDGTEVHVFQSDPKDPAVPVVAAPSPTKFAPSTMLYEWSFMNERSVENGVGTGGFSHAICNPRHGSIGVPLSSYDCRTPDARAVFAEPVASQPWFTPDGRHAVFGSDRLYLQDVATGVSEPLVDSILTTPYPVASDAIFQTTVDSRKLLRLDGRGSFPVIDLDRAECPLLDSEEDAAARCLAASERISGIQELQVLGYHAGLKGLVVIVWTTKGRLLVLATRDRTRRLAHENFFDGGWFDSLESLPSGGVVAAFTEGSERALRMFDDAFRPVSTQPSPLATTGRFFRHGMFSATGLAYYTVPPNTGETGGCVTVRGLTLCAFDPQRAYNLDVRQNIAYREWVPVPEGLERGEALFWASGWREPGGVVITRWQRDWALWRVSRLGGVLRWLDDAAFAALLEDDDRARLASDPLREVRVTASSADPWRVCFVEAPLDGEGRAWELELDPQTRTPVGARFVEAGGVRACGYDEGSLVVLREERGAKAEAVLDFEDGREVRVPFLGPTGFVRLGDHWVFLGDGTASCAKASTSSPKVVGHFQLFAATVAKGLLHWVERDGRGFVAGEAAVCGEGGPFESLHYFDAGQDPTPFWTRVARNRYGTNQWEAKVSGATLALRPDGVMLVAPENLTAREAEGLLPDFYRDMLHRFHPSYTPLNWDHRLGSLDAKRRGPTRVEAMTIDATGVRAVSVVPWTEEWPDLGWEYLGGEKPPPRRRPEAPKEEPDPVFNDLPEQEAPACGCGASPLTALGLLGVLLLRRRRR